jgi:hypothetical protein
MRILYRAILISLGMLLAACARPPGPNPTAMVSVGLSATPTGFSSPLSTPTPGLVVVLPTSTYSTSPLATVMVASPLSTPTSMPSPTATRTPADTPTPSPSPTALIVPVTPTRLPGTPKATRAPVLSLPTLIPGPTSTRAPTPTPAPTVAPILVTAWVSNPDPQPGVDVMVYGRLLVNGRPESGEGMVARWHIKGGRTVDCVADTWVDGVAYCTENTYGLPAGFTVRIEVFIKYNQVPYRATTELTIDD